MEIDITKFVENADPYEFSASIAERGESAGRDTWNNSIAESLRNPLLITADQLKAFRDHMRGYGAWDDEKIAGWSDDECNALFIQLVSGDMRESGMDDVFPDEFYWHEYERRVQAGSVSGRIYRGDSGKIYFDLGD